MEIPDSDEKVKFVRFDKALRNPTFIKILEILSERGGFYSDNGTKESPFAFYMV